MGFFTRFIELFRKPKFGVSPTYDHPEKEKNKKWRRRGARKLSIITDNVKASSHWIYRKRKYQ